MDAYSWPIGPVNMYFLPMHFSLTHPMTSLSQEHVCHCGHTFKQYGNLKCHQRSCRAMSNMLSEALAKGKVLLVRKQHHLAKVGPNSPIVALSSLDVSETCYWDLNGWSHFCQRASALQKCGWEMLSPPRLRTPVQRVHLVHCHPWVISLHDIYCSSLTYYLDHNPKRWPGTHRCCIHWDHGTDCFLHYLECHIWIILCSPPPLRIWTMVNL